MNANSSEVRVRDMSGPPLVYREILGMDDPPELAQVLAGAVTYPKFMRG